MLAQQLEPPPSGCVAGAAFVVQTSLPQFITNKGVSNYTLMKFLLNGALKFSVLYFRVHHYIDWPIKIRT